MALLEVKDLSVSFGNIHALKNVSLSVPKGDISVVLGANGAGKSTLLKVIAGALFPKKGQIYFKDQEITAQKSYQRVRKGIVIVPEARQILVSMTIEENLLLGAHHRKDHAQVRREIQSIYDRFSNLASRRHMLASCLSGGEQQMLAIGRALLAKPSLIMLDEPSLGLSPLLVEQMFSLLVELKNNWGHSILLVEQNIYEAMAIAQWATVLELGSVVVKGSSAELMQDSRVQEAYFGSVDLPIG